MFMIYDFGMRIPPPVPVRDAQWQRDAKRREAGKYAVFSH